MVSRSSNGDVGDDINMILSATRFWFFHLFYPGMCIAAIKAFELDKIFCVQNVTSVGISYELQRKESVGEEGNFLKAFYICVLFTHKDQLC